MLMADPTALAEDRRRCDTSAAGRLAMDVLAHLYQGIVAPILALTHHFFYRCPPRLSGRRRMTAECPVPKPIAQGGMLRNALIAIVDDDESVREALKGLMKSLGFAAASFSCAEEFLNSSRQHHAACLIADVQMPGMSGVDLHHRLVASGQPIPTILVTAYPDERMRARALEAGVIGYLTKPFNEDDLLVCLRSVLGDRAAAAKEP
jgi:CheY-like chemotaxis protein